MDYETIREMSIDGIAIDPRLVLALLDRIGFLEDQRDKLTDCIYEYLEKSDDVSKTKDHQGQEVS